MQVVKITPKELTLDLIFRLNHLYHAELGEFVVMADNRKEILYVNKKVSKKDIDGFLEVIMFPEYAVADDDAPTGQFLDYVYHKYGFHTYMALMDAHSWRMEQKEKARVCMSDEQFYKESIVKMVYSIRNVDWLLKIYSFIKVFAEDKEESDNDRKKRKRAFCNGDHQ